MPKSVLGKQDKKEEEEVHPWLSTLCALTVDMTQGQAAECSADSGHNAADRKLQAESSYRPCARQATIRACHYREHITTTYVMKLHGFSFPQVPRIRNTSCTQPHLEQHDHVTTNRWLDLRSARGGSTCKRQ
eukprot:4470615-Amphidinium_carterae.1